MLAMLCGVALGSLCTITGVVFCEKIVISTMKNMFDDKED